mmetsp:Transcript_36440/g.104947  ORF Transcript_36440/g.104947 Transcript_36440/m.104947 type:complete len:252 (-) Transcript_36440:1091-1846(-)
MRSPGLHDAGLAGHRHLLQLEPGLCRAHLSQPSEPQGHARGARSLPSLGACGGGGALHHSVRELLGHAGRGSRLLGRLGALHAGPGSLEVQPVLVCGRLCGDLDLGRAGHPAADALPSARPGQRLLGGRLPLAHGDPARAQPVSRSPKGLRQAGVAAPAARRGGLRRSAGDPVCGHHDRAGQHGGGQVHGAARGDHSVQPGWLLGLVLGRHGHWPGAQRLHPEWLAVQLPCLALAAVQSLALPRLADHLHQ